MPDRGSTIRRLLLLMSAAPLLCACDLTPAYQRPAADVPADWRETTQMSAPPGPAWWTQFNSSELDDLMKQADAQNFDIAAAVARVEEANAQARISGAALLPTVQANGQVERTKQTVPMAEEYSAYQLAGQVSYELDFWGKNRSAYNSAKETAIATAFDREVVRLTTESSVATTYFRYAGLQMRVAVAQENQANAAKLLDGLTKEFQVGIATALDVTQQQTELASVSATIPPLQQQASQALDALAILVGEQPERLKLLTQSLDPIAIPKVAPGLPSQLLERRPDVRESEAQLLAANYNIGNARAQFYPDINLTAEGGVESKALSQLFTPQGLIYDLLASATQPIFDGGRLEGQLDYTKAKYREQLADYKKSVISAFGDVEDNLAAVSRSAQALNQQAVAADKARSAYRMVQQQFQAGTINIVQVLQVEQSLFTQEDAYAQARLNQLQAIVGLFKAFGGGWSDAATPPGPSQFHADASNGKRS